LLTSKMKARIRREMTDEEPTIWIGKNGVTDQSLKELLKQLDKNEIIKVKILKSALKDEDAKNIIQKIVQKTGSTRIDQRGHVLILYKPRERKKPL